jgi:sirohydrochlorin ferrochelatase
MGMVQVGDPMFRALVLTALLVTPAASFAQAHRTEGILLLAHGGAADWNQRVTALASTLDATQPTEVAFGMASRPALQSAIDKLVTRGVTAIVAVPLFISSHSSVVTSTAYLLGVRPDMPADLRIFAKMNHGAHGSAASAGHEGHGDGSAAAADNTRPVTSPVPVRMTEALNRHRLVGEILIDRAREVSTSPQQEAVVIVAHGPVPDVDNQRWLQDMQVLAQQLDDATSFAAIDYLTVRDDAPKPVRDAATSELRALVENHTRLGRRVLIVPLLLSYGGIEKGVRQRLEGLEYAMAERALMPDDRLAEWVRHSIAP